MADTVYQIKLEYVADTAGATKGVDNLGFKMISLNQSVELFRKGWDMARSVVGPMLDINKELEMSRIRIAGIANATEGWTGGIKKGIAEADVLIKGFTADAAASVATTKDFVDIGARLAPVLLPAGKSMKDLRDTTKAVVDGASALGLNLGMAGDQLSRMIMGQAGADLVTFTTLFASDMNKFGRDFTKTFNEMEQSKRLDLILAKLKEFAPAGALIESSFTGVTSTLEDLYELTLAGVGKPLFEAITKELQSWLEWINANRRSVEQFVSGAGQALLDTFRMLKDAIVYIVDHREELMGLAVAWGAVKLGGGMAGMAGFAGKALGGAGVGKGAALAVNVVAIAGAAAAALAAHILGEQRRELDRGENVSSIMDTLFGVGVGSADTKLKRLAGAGLSEDAIEAMRDPKFRERMRAAVEMTWINPARDLLEKNMPPALRDLTVGMREAGYGAKELNLVLQELGLLADKASAAKAFAELTGPPLEESDFSKRLGERNAAIAKMNAAAEAAKKKRLEKMKLEVTIIQDFKDNANPDRIKVATVRALEKVARNRVMARTAPALG